MLCELRPPLGGLRRISVNMLVDHVIAVAECSLAVQFGLVVAAASLQIDLPDSEALVSRAWETYCAALLRAGGWSDAAVTLHEDGEVRIAGRADRVVSIVELASMLPYLPPTSGIIRCNAYTSSGLREVVLAAPPLRAHAGAIDGVEKQLAFATAIRSTTVDGEPIASAEQFRKFVTCALSDSVTDRENQSAVMRAFKAARASAAACGDQELEKAVRVAQGWRSDGLIGLKRDVEDIRAFIDFSTAKVADIDYTF